MQPDEPTDEEREEQLAEDGQTPFSPADEEIDDTAAEDERETKKLDDTHPSTDTDVQQEGVYQDGLADEVGASEPNQGNAVVGYDPEAEDEQIEGTS